MIIFGYRFFEKDIPKESESVSKLNLIAENENLKKRVKMLDEQVRDLQAKVDTPFVDTDIGDPTPIGSEERKIYVATVAGLHKEILEPKLKQMISSCHIVLEGELNSPRQDDMMKGAIYAFRELLRWGVRMVNEQVANQNNNK